MRILFFRDNLALVFVDQGKNVVFFFFQPSFVAYMESHTGRNVSWFFHGCFWRSITAIVDHVFTMLNMTLPNVCSVVCVSVSSRVPHHASSSSSLSTSLCHHMTASFVNLVGQRVAVESPTSIATVCVSSLEQQSDAPETSVSCMDQDTVSATVYNTVSRANVAGKRVL